jgi:hypothetical protein
MMRWMEPTIRVNEYEFESRQSNINCEATKKQKSYKLGSDGDNSSGGE